MTKGANLSHGVVNFHFTNKETLYVETLGYLAQEHYDQWHSAVKNGGDDPVKQLTGLVGADFHPKICSQKKLAVWFAFWGQAKYRPNYLEVHNDYDDQRLANLERLCSEIAEDGGYDHVDPEATARRIEAVIDGLWLQLLLYPKMLNRETAKNDCFAYLSDVFPKHFHHYWSILNI